MLNKFLFFCWAISIGIYAQDSLSLNNFKLSDSSKVKTDLKLFNLDNPFDYKDKNLTLNYTNKNDYFDVSQYYPQNVMPKNFYELDYRSGSYYVPRMVKDELNLIMNRPRDNSFVPILGVAFLAAQMASKYVFVKDKLKVSNENILNTIEDYDILFNLWKENPQTVSQLYNYPNINKKYVFNDLIRKVDELIDNKLIKQKNVEDKEMLLFPSITKMEYFQLLEKIDADTLTSLLQKEKIENFLKNK